MSRYTNLNGSKKISEDFGNINTGFDKVQQEMDVNIADIASHKASSAAHAAGSITYSGSVTGAGNVKQAIDKQDERIDNLVLNGDSSPQATDAMYSTPKGKLFGSLKDRVDATDTDVATLQAENVYINLLKYDAPLDGTTDCLTAFNQAITAANTIGGARIVAPFNNNGYSISAQLLLDYNTVLDLQGSSLKPIGALNVASGNSLIKVRFGANVIDNVRFEVNAGQYGIEFGTGAQNNLEMRCTTNVGYNYLIKTESDNQKPQLNRSLSLEAVSRTSLPKSTVKKLQFTVSLGGSEYNPTIAMRPFPSECKIVKLAVTDDGGSPDFAFEIRSQSTPSIVYTYERARASSNINDTTPWDYYKLNNDDILVFGIANSKVTATTFTLDIWFEEEVYKDGNKVFQYHSKEDFKRPHADSIGSATAVTPTTIQQVEYRYTDNTAAVKRVGVTPSRKSDLLYNYPSITLPSPGGSTQQDPSTYSEIKFYLDYPASRAVLERPTHLKFIFHSVPKTINAKLIVGWYSQNPDNVTPSFLKSSSILEEDITINPSTYASGHEIIVPLDPKGYQKGSVLEGNQSMNFLYFVLFQEDSSYSPYLFGEEYVFNAYLFREESTF